MTALNTVLIPSSTIKSNPINDEDWVKARLQELIPESADILGEVARCESGYQMKWNYMNPLGDLTSKWSAYGYFQITKSTALAADPTLDRFKPLDNIKLAIKIFNSRGLQPWQLSASCHS